jgi:hypothetical protein
MADRQAAWRELANAHLRSREHISGGIRLVFSPNEGVESTLRDLAELEARCCAFASWAVERREEGVALEVTAEGEAAHTVRSMFAAS